MKLDLFMPKPIVAELATQVLHYRKRCDDCLSTESLIVSQPGVLHHYAKHSFSAPDPCGW